MIVALLIVVAIALNRVFLHHLDKRLQHVEHEIAHILVDSGQLSVTPGSEIARRREAIVDEATVRNTYVE